VKERIIELEIPSFLSSIHSNSTGKVKEVSQQLLDILQQ
jgi:hypothetical protein